jgi:CelD/BcsL family acetyltransferase involved in cellulose biosynthesis
LSRGRDQLWARLQKKWRHGVGYAARSCVDVSTTRDPERVHEFYRLCQSVSHLKGFSLPASESLMRILLEAPENGPVSSHLFAATCEGRLAAGAFIIKCGRHIHYFWGATDRELAKLRPGEALHWAIIEWAISQGCTLYDLEGIDPVGNAGTYEFKRKMGGDEVTFPAVATEPLSLRGRLIAPVLTRLVGRI